MNFLPTSWFNKKEDTSYVSGGRKLRILGLTNPEKAMKEAKASLNYQHSLHNAVRISNSDALDVLGGKESSSKWENLEAPIILIRESLLLDHTMKKNGLAYNMNQELFTHDKDGYTFSHKFISKKDPDLYGYEKQTLAVVEISDRAIIHTIQEIGEDSFQKLEKSLGSLFVYTNHDYTMHRQGMGIAENEYIYDLLDNKVDRLLPYSWNVANQEPLSAAFHKDMIEEMSEKGLPIFESIEKHAFTVLSEIEKIQKPELQKYWLTLVKYPLFSLVDPTEGESSGASQKIMTKLRGAFPSLNLKATTWGKAVHISNVPLNVVGAMGERAYIPIRKMRELIMQGLKTNDPQFEETIVAEASKILGYSSKITCWKDLNRAMQAIKMDLPETATDEEISNTNSYNIVVDVLQGIIHGINFGIYELENILLMKSFLEKKGFEFSQYKEIDLPSIIQKKYIIKLKDNVKTYEETQDMFIAFTIEDDIKGAKRNGYDVSEATSTDWNKKNNEEILRQLKEAEEFMNQTRGTPNFKQKIQELESLVYKFQKRPKIYDFGAFESYDFETLYIEARSSTAATG